jgi:two-component system, NarL family, nitrate/nitrite response regulator NarL
LIPRGTLRDAAEQPPRLGIVGSDRLFAETLRVVLEQQGMEVIVTTGPSEALDQVESSAPDLLLIDLEGDGGGTELGRMLLERDQDLKVVGLAASHDRKALRESVRAGFHGFMTKQVSVAGLVSGLRRALAGRLVRPRRGTRETLARRGADEGIPAALLTARERQVLALLVLGSRNLDIARQMGISPHTVRTHVQSILAKLQVHTRLQAAAWATRNRLVRVPNADSLGQPESHDQGGDFAP